MATSRATYGSRRRTCAAPSASSGTGPRWGSRKAFGNSSAGTRRFMDVSAEHLVEQARERFQLQDYYGAIHLLEEVVTAGRTVSPTPPKFSVSSTLVAPTQQEPLPRARAPGP